ncbi:MAG: NAD+ synthase [Rhodothermales bacterium]
MKIALAQINPVVGDLRGNSRKIVDYARRARRQGADLVVFPECCVIGYPPQDLIENRFFIEATGRAVAWIAAEVPQDMGIIIGAPVFNEAPVGKRFLNVTFVYEGGRRVGEVQKTLLPTYDVFDEYRHFEPSSKRHVVEWRDLKLGLHICEDMWNNQADAAYHLYHQNPIDDLAALGADLLINVSASPFAVGKHEERNRLIEESCREHHIPFVFVNQVGANTEVIFDGDSRVHAADGTRLLCAPSFEEALLVWDMEAHDRVCPMKHDDIADLHDALVLGIRDYFHKTGVFTKALIGLSGGIDSAVTCALAVAALGPDRIVGVTMPSKYSSAGSVDDSQALADHLGIAFHTIPIKPAVAAFDEMLADVFAGTPPGIAEENIQARARGLTLMALSNKFGYLLLSTGNKSEMAVGYATLYGDTNGGVAVLSDVLKTRVYELARYINRRAGRTIIPESTLTKPPSAELRPDQQDQDSLPPYPVLDEILRRYIEEQQELDAIVAATGFDRTLVHDILRRVDRNEYKRRQAPPGLRLTMKAFGIGRRLPIVMRWDRTVVEEMAQPDAVVEE